jgi:hypothetical protein
MKKTLLIASLLAVALAACGKKEEATPAASVSVTTPAAPAASAPAADAAASAPAAPAASAPAADAAASAPAASAAASAK